MAKYRSIDDLRTAHLHLDKSLALVMTALPPYFNEQKVALDAVYAEIEAASKARTCVGLQKTTDGAQRNAWIERANDAMARAKHYLRATAPDTVREYFPEAAGVAHRKIDRLHAVRKALTVSEHFGHAHLGSFQAELEVLRLEGEAIFGAASASKTEQKTEVERLAELKTRWEAQYQKVKYLVRGFFYGSSTDWAKFFDDSRTVPKTGTSKSEPESAADPGETIALAS